jgi:hypothetical protein
VDTVVGKRIVDVVAPTPLDDRSTTFATDAIAA